MTRWLSIGPVSTRPSESASCERVPLLHERQEFDSEAAMVHEIILPPNFPTLDLVERERRKNGHDAED